MVHSWKSKAKRIVSILLEWRNQIYDIIFHSISLHSPVAQVNLIGWKWRTGNAFVFNNMANHTGKPVEYSKRFATGIICLVPFFYTWPPFFIKFRIGAGLPTKYVPRSCLLIHFPAGVRWAVGNFFIFVTISGVAVCHKCVNITEWSQPTGHDVMNTERKILGGFRAK